MIVYEYVDHRGFGVISEWFRRLQVPHQAALDNKLEIVVTGEIPPNLFRGPVKHRGTFYPNTFKLTVNCGIALRPLGCPGPYDAEREWTLMVPVIEVGNTYNPADFAECERRRNEVLGNRFKRRIFRDDKYYE